MTSKFPNTGSLVEGHDFAGGDTKTEAINSTLSTQIIIKVDSEPIGALQRLSVSQNRPLNRIQEIGTDGVIEIVPQGATTFELIAERIVFDQLRLPESFKRGFRFINSQRLPFDILVLDISAVDPAGDDPASDPNIVSMVYKNCWFTRYDTPYAADNYIITETATIWCETAYLSSSVGAEGIPLGGGIRGLTGVTDSAGIEGEVNTGSRRGAMDASGLVNSIFG